MSEQAHILVIEDWPEDQEQFEHLLCQDGEYGPVCFAWDGWKEEVPDIEKIKEIIRSKGIVCVLLDLAWTRSDEEEAIRLRHVNDTEKIIERNDKLPPNQRIHGIRFLEQVRPDFPNLYIMVITQYQTEPLAKVCMRKGANAVYKKWDEMEPFIDNVFSVLKLKREIRANI